MDKKKLINNLALIESALMKIKSSFEQEHVKPNIPKKLKKSEEIRRAILETSIEMGVFRIDDVLRNIKIGACDYSMSTVHTGLTRMIEENKIKRLRRGVYKIVIISR